MSTRHRPIPWFIIATLFASTAQGGPPVPLLPTATAIAERVAHKPTRAKLLADAAAVSPRPPTQRPARRRAAITVPSAVALPGLLPTPANQRVLSAVGDAQAGKPNAKKRLLTLHKDRYLADEDRWYKGVPLPPAKPGDKGDLSSEAGEAAGCEALDGHSTNDACELWNPADRALVHLVAGLVALNAWSEASGVADTIRAPLTRARGQALVDRALWAHAAAGRWTAALQVGQQTTVARHLAVVEAMEGRASRSALVAAGLGLAKRILADDPEYVESPPEAIALARVLLRHGEPATARRLLAPVAASVSQYDSGGFMAEEEKMRDFTALSVAWALAGSPSRAVDAVMDANDWVWQLAQIGPHRDTSQDPEGDDPEGDDPEGDAPDKEPLPFVHPQEPLTSAFKAAHGSPRRALRIALAAADLLEHELAACGLVDAPDVEVGTLAQWCPSRRGALDRRRKHARRLTKLSSRLRKLDSEAATRARLRAAELILHMARPSKVARLLIELARVSGRSKLALSAVTRAHVLRLATGAPTPPRQPLSLKCAPAERHRRGKDRYGRARVTCVDSEGQPGAVRVRAKNGVVIAEVDAEGAVRLRRLNGTLLEPAKR